MTGYLLDTSVLLKWATSPASLSNDARIAIANGRNTVFVSAAVALELAMEELRGTLSKVPDIGELLKANRFTELAVSIAHVQASKSLPTIHRDPYDRLLIAQAMQESLIFITEDKAILDCDVQTLAA